MHTSAERRPRTRSVCKTTGSFELRSSRLLIGDPLSSKPGSAVDRAVRGTWFAVVRKLRVAGEGEWCSHLTVIHADHDAATWEPGGSFAVNSGSAGVFAGEDPTSCFAACRSGYGDGLYTYEIGRDKRGRVVALRLTFLR